MKLYPVPGGTWEGTEADWKKALAALGLDHKKFRDSDGKPLTKEVPTGKKDLMEFLTFYTVDVYRTGGAAPTTTVPAIDVEALRRQHNPDAPDLPPAPIERAPAGDPPTRSMTTDQLTAEFNAAPIRVQAELVVGFADRAASLGAVVGQ